MTKDRESAIRAGFIGLGNIGTPMALRLVEAGFETTVFDVAAGPMAELEAAGARAAGSPRELAGRCDVVGLCVRDDTDVRNVICAEDGLLAGAAAGTVIAVHSTVLPSTVTDIAERAVDSGVRLVDACITGGQSGAEQGTLTYMVGGADDDVERCKPIFETSAKLVVHTGKLGTGAATKLCNNLMTYLGFLATFEASLLARESGLSFDALEEVARSNGNMGEQQVAFAALHRLPDDVRSDAGFQEHMRGFMTLAEKDLTITLQYARENGVALPATGLCAQLMARVYAVDDPRRR
ncbi:MAG: NAD(P)-dependent oxidoreductase [Myxococcales bacterium]|nr:MAG: NAD(P)-dependent oxidoreductase [Myxococcales bacterium]